MTVTLRVLCLVSLMCLASACTPVAEGAQKTAQGLGEARDDVADSVRELFIYNPKPKTPQPSTTRYCYKFASDIVCYDNPQASLTAKLVGVQGPEGARVIAQPVPYEAAVSSYTPVYAVPVESLPGAPLDTSGPVGSSNSSVQIQSRDLGAAPAPFNSGPSATAKP